jgi:hypothetical protein
MPLHPGRLGPVGSLARQPGGLPFDPLDEFENVEEDIDRRRVRH